MVKKVVSRQGISKLGILVETRNLTIYDEFTRQIESKRGDSFEIIHTRRGASVFVVDSEAESAEIEKEQTDCCVILLTSEEHKVRFLKKKNIRQHLMTPQQALRMLLSKDALNLLRVPKSAASTRRN